MRRLDKFLMVLAWLVASVLSNADAYFWPSVLWPVMVGPGAWIGLYGLLGIKMVYILAVLSLSRIEYLYKIENKFGDGLHVDPRLPLLELDMAVHGPPSGLEPSGRRRRRLRNNRLRGQVRAKITRKRIEQRRRQRENHGASLRRAPSEGDGDRDEQTNYPKPNYEVNYPEAEPSQPDYSGYLPNYGSPPSPGFGQMVAPGNEPFAIGQAFPPLSFSDYGRAYAAKGAGWPDMGHRRRGRAVLEGSKSKQVSGEDVLRRRKGRRRKRSLPLLRLKLTNSK
ncbi:hypothetical protein HDE_10001 [Halotydeus destructor]|nr:hypothetical protein HDE_10001 [Halotydeus destructor]